MWIQRALALVSLMAVSALVSAQTLNAVVATALPGNQTELRFEFTDQPAEPKIYAVDTPARLVVDLWGVDKSEQLDRSITVGSGPVSKLRFAETDDRLRVVVELSESVGYQTSIQGNQLILSMGNATQVSAGAVRIVLPQPVESAVGSTFDSIAAAEEDGRSCAITSRARGSLAVRDPGVGRWARGLRGKAGLHLVDLCV